MKKDPFSILRHPVITEKSTDLREKSNQIVFEVAKSANKTEIKKAVETLFKVKVMSVRTINIMGKTKRVGRKVGLKSDWKKAIAKIKEGDQIQLFEGA